MPLSLSPRFPSPSRESRPRRTAAAKNRRNPFISQFNPKDARFVGTPLDFIVFDGLDEGGEVKRIVFVEVKTGRAGLASRERRCRDAIEAGRVEYQLLRLPGDDGPVPELPVVTVEELEGPAP